MWWPLVLRCFPRLLVSFAHHVLALWPNPSLNPRPATASPPWSGLAHTLGLANHASEIPVFEFPLQDHPEYSRRLMDRIQHAVIVPPARVSIGTWEPAENDCHANVTTWCANAQGFEIVRGWLYFDMADTLPFVLFNAHSVVRNPEGQLWDITPQRATRPYPFLAAEETEEEYARFVEAGAVRLRHFK